MLFTDHPSINLDADGDSRYVHVEMEGFAFGDRLNEVHRTVIHLGWMVMRRVKDDDGDDHDDPYFWVLHRHDLRPPTLEQVRTLAQAGRDLLRIPVKYVWAECYSVTTAEMRKSSGVAAAA